MTSSRVIVCNHRDDNNYRSSQSGVINNYRIRFCCALSCCGCIASSSWIHVISLPIFFRVASLALGQSCDCPSGSEATLKDMARLLLTPLGKPSTDLVHIFWYVQSDTIITLRPRQNDRRFAGDTFKRIFLTENVIISIKIPLKFVPKGQFNNIPALVQIMAWCRPGDKPLSESMMVRLPTYICVTRPQWV